MVVIKPPTQLKEQMDKLIREYGYVELEEYISDYRLLIIDFEDSQMLFHLIYIPTMEIVSYSKPIQSVSTVINNNEYCRLRNTNTPRTNNIFFI